jgi:hypothetical protein
VGFGIGDVMYLANTDASSVHVVDDNGQIEVHLQQGGLPTQSFDLHGNYDPAGFTIAQDGDGKGTDITWNHPAPTIDTTHFTLSQDGDVTTIHGLQVTDDDASVTSFTVAADTAKGPESSLSPASASGDLASINAALSSISYNPGANPPQADQVNVTVTDNFGDSSTVHFVFNEAESGPDISLSGTTGNDVIFATSQADTLTGHGGIDQFVFKPSSPTDTVTVEHTITDFDVNHDTIDLRQFANVSSAADVLATATPQGTDGSDTLLTLDDHQTVLLKNVTAGQLHTNDFIITPH